MQNAVECCRKTEIEEKKLKDQPCFGIDNVSSSLHGGGNGWPIFSVKRCLLMPVLGAIGRGRARFAAGRPGLRFMGRMKCRPRLVACTPHHPAPT